MPPHNNTTASRPEPLEVLPQTPRQTCNRRAPWAANKTPSPPPPPPPPRRRRRQPAPQAEPNAAPAPDAHGEPGPAATNGQAPQLRTPDIFDDDPPAAPSPRPHANVHFGDGSPGGGEFFPSLSPSPGHHLSPTPAGPHAPPSRAPVRAAGSRSGSARDVWTFFEGEEGKDCLICRTGVLRKHLYEHHLDVWVAGCDQLKIAIKAKEAKPFADDYRARREHTTASTSDPKPQEKRTEFSQEAFVDTIVEFIVGDDQSINVIENKQLRAIFLMLRSELRDQDIPHRTTVHKRIIEVWDEHLNTLEREHYGASLG
ncbi:hypothetical protein C8R45DRAFT_926503 [Mycena sanguinolenta]|nr:hypothetical protein C8R45DRAFT_926503 [Mycena sanguinolenta]